MLFNFQKWTVFCIFNVEKWTPLKIKKIEKFLKFLLEDLPHDSFTQTLHE